MLNETTIGSTNRLKSCAFRGRSRINFRGLQDFTNKIEHRNDIIKQKNYRFSKKQQSTVLIPVGVQI